MCVCVVFMYVRACVRACVHACVRVEIFYQLSAGKFLLPAAVCKSLVHLVRVDEVLMLQSIQGRVILIFNILWLILRSTYFGKVETS